MHARIVVFSFKLISYKLMGFSILTVPDSDFFMARNNPLASVFLPLFREPKINRQLRLIKPGLIFWSLFAPKLIRPEILKMRLLLEKSQHSFLLYSIDFFAEKNSQLSLPLIYIRIFRRNLDSTPLLPTLKGILLTSPPITITNNNTTIHVHYTKKGFLNKMVSRAVGWHSITVIQKDSSILFTGHRIR